MTTEPLVNIVPPLTATDAERDEAARQHENQYQATDILTGSICPELGGSSDLLDLVGLNFYYDNQFYFVRSGLANVQVWILRPEPMPLLNGVPERIGLVQLVQ